jgi:hypothetical protein
MNDQISLQTGATPEPHEIATANFLARHGKIVRFLAPVRRAGARIPDIEMDDLKWEIKCPKGSSSRTIENNFRTAIRQSSNLIFDLRRTTLPDDKCVRRLEKEFIPRKSARNMLIITKLGKILDFHK